MGFDCYCLGFGCVGVCVVWVVYCLAGFGFRLLASFELVGVGLCGVFGWIGLGLGLLVGLGGLVCSGYLRVGWGF